MLVDRQIIFRIVQINERIKFDPDSISVAN